MEILYEKEGRKYVMDKDFDLGYLAPVRHYVNSKAVLDAWDDYNEYDHAVQSANEILLDPELWIDTHVMYQGMQITGVLLIIGGKIGKLENKYTIAREERSLLLKYFHIIDKGKGYGSFWINSVVIPWYKVKGYQYLYVNSSHPDSFPFYSRLGSLIARYEQISDNNRFKRKGSCFVINI